MSTYSNRLQPALQNLLQRVRFFHPRSSCMTHIGGHFRWTKITRKASEVAENLQLYWVVWFFHPRLSCTTTHISADVQRITLNASCSCMTISDGRTKQLDIFCRITGFKSDFLSFVLWNLFGSSTQPFNYSDLIPEFSAFRASLFRPFTIVLILNCWMKSHCRWQCNPLSVNSC